jgi:hypothetical protein
MTMRSVRSRVRPAPQEAVSYRKHGSGNRIGEDAGNILVRS